MSKKELSTEVNEDVLAELRGSYPTEPSALKIMLPRLGMVSQDVTEGKGKAMKVVSEAGTFFIESQTDEIDEATGKKKWDREEIGTTIQGVILYQRKQLRYYDEANEKYTSSPVYDTDDEIVPLFCDKKEIARGTPGDLKKNYEYVKDGKVKSKLEENRILYVLYKGTKYQMNLRGSSMYSFMSYNRTTLPPSVLTKFGSESKEKGTIAWNQMTFSVVRQLDGDESVEALENIRSIKNAIAVEKASYAAVVAKDTADDKAMDALVEGAASKLD